MTTRQPNPGDSNNSGPNPEPPPLTESQEVDFQDAWENAGLIFQPSSSLSSGNHEDFNFDEQFYLRMPSESSCSQDEPSDCDTASVTASAGPFDKDPVNVNVETRASLSATKTDPKCCMHEDGPTWSWSVTASEYRQNETDEWGAGNYTPTIDHSDTKSSSAKLVASIPTAGCWRFKAKATASWACWDGNCSKNDETDWIELKITNCDWKLEVVPDKMFNGRSLSRVGVGETGIVKIVPVGGTDINSLGPVTWECTPESCMAITGGNALQTSFSAKGCECAAKVCATIGDCHQCTTIDVVEPSGIHFTRGTKIKHTQGKIDFDAILKFYVTPTDVSFHKVEVLEHDKGAIGNGIFEEYTGTGHQPQESWAPLARVVVVNGKSIGTFSTAGDQLAILAADTPVGDGLIGWLRIPWDFRLKGDSADGKEFVKIKMGFDVRANTRVITAFKGDYIELLSIDAPTETSY